MRTVASDPWLLELTSFGRDTTVHAVIEEKTGNFSTGRKFAGGPRLTQILAALR